MSKQDKPLGSFTPGPWEVVPADAGYRAPDKQDFAVLTGELYCVGTVWGGFGTRGESDARLIAAAPELLEALTALLAQHDRPHGFDDESWYACEVAKARAALLKARGEA